MTPAQLVELFILAAIWGASFLLMRLGAGEFGPFALSGVRVSGALLFLLPLAALQRQPLQWRKHWRVLLLVGITSSALPFLCYAYAAMWIPAGLSSVLNATTPLFGAAIAWVWLGDRLAPSRVAGLVVGFAGVAGLIASRGGFEPAAGAAAPLAALGACLVSTLCYGISACATRRYLGEVPPLSVAAGSQVAASLLLLPPAVFAWPATSPSTTAWVAALLLAVVCTGVAYVIYFRLIAHAGPANAMSVTYLIPLFAMGWGGLVLHERVTLQMAMGCAVILLGIALTTGLVSLPSRTRSQSPTEP
jgi:drug/metabolite transporter (DMT)-like permease